MNEYRIQRLKEDLTYAQQRNKHQKQQLANYKKVHEKDLKEIERLNKSLEEQRHFYLEEIKKKDNIIKELSQRSQERSNEIDRYIDILDKLEKYLNKEYLGYNEEDLQYYYGKDILDKLNELKGSDKE